MSAQARPPRGLLWRVLVPVVCLAAGLGFAISARDAGGTDLRASSTPGTDGLVRTVRAAEDAVREADGQARELQLRLDSETRRLAAGSRRSSRTAIGERTRIAAGSDALRGAGVLITLDDASQADNPGADPNQLLIHQSDVQSIVNALWAGGAQAMSIEAQRVIATSAVRCVGNTLLINGNVYSPPYSIVALGPAAAMQHALDASPGVRFFRNAAEFYGLVDTVAPSAALRVPAYRGPTTLTYARPGA